MLKGNVWRFLRVTFYTLGIILISSGFITDPPVVKHSYPQDYFQMPVNRKALLSGSFGELRPNHFHAGLDIKSRNGSSGDEIVAAATGYVSRIKVAASGYGNALYIAHPKGYTTVYAHLARFAPEINAYVKQMQYAQKSFEIDLYPESSRFTFDKGEMIGYMGNSGSSTAPHLHFEIRLTNGQIPVNPILFGLPVEDTISPSIHGVKSYCLNEKLEIIADDQHRLRHLGNHRYTLYDTLELQAWRAAFAVKSYDRMNGASNLNGIYKLEMLVDDSLQYSFSMNQIAFSETRFLNAHIDYGDRLRGKGYWNRCYTLPGNRCSIYSLFEDQGIVKLFEKKARKITFLSYDAAGNRSVLEFWVKRQQEIPIPDNVLYHHLVVHDRTMTLDHGGFKATYSDNTFYQNTYLEILQDTQQNNKFLSPVYRINPWDAAVHHYYDLSIAIDGIDKKYLSKVIVVNRVPGGNWTSLGGHANGDKVFSQARELGEFSVMLDTIPPYIRPVSWSRNMHGYNTLSFRISDNIYTRGRANDLKYRVTIDGKWILMEYDKKLGRITHYFDEHTGPGEHTVYLEVWDDRNNVSVFIGKFLR